MNEKIKNHHLTRKAILYVRQSSSYQVVYNEESRRLQYAMRERLEQLGWEQIEVIDEDLGRSAAGSVERHGFERMVAEVCLGKVAAVAAREVSRFARNSREWQQLVEVCHKAPPINLRKRIGPSTHCQEPEMALPLARHLLKQASRVGNVNIVAPR